jgi:nicotinamidase-related amidase
LADRDHLHGRGNRKSAIALLLIDFINDLEFPEGDKLLRQALPAARNTAALKRRAHAAGIPVIYVNDNFGRWRSDFKMQIQHCLEDGVRGEEMVRLLLPDEEDYFVLKPKSSAFFDTTLHTVLNHLSATTLILTGLAADVCILFSAHDAHLRDYKIIVPSDCVASESARDTAMALKNMRKSTHAVVSKSKNIDFRRLKTTSRALVPGNE